MAGFRHTGALRLIVWSIAALCIGFFLFSRKWPDYPRAVVDYAAMARDGQPIAEAIERFHAERGLWPEFAGDVAPDYLPKRPVPEWDYEMGRSLLRRAPNAKAYVRYDFAAAPVSAAGTGVGVGAPGWKKIDVDGNESILEGVTQGATATRAATLPAERITTNELAEYDRRIARTRGRGVMDYFQAKAALLHELGRDDELRALVAQAHARVPDHYWPLLTAALLSPQTAPPPASMAATTNPAPGAATTASAPATAPASAASNPALAPGAAFVEWVRANPSFTHYFYLAWYFHERGDGAASLAALHEAQHYPIEADVDDPAPHDAYAFAATQLAYEMSDFSLVLQLTQLWERRAAAGGKNEDKSYFTFRAAAELATGDAKNAMGDAAAAVALNATQPLWAKNLDALLAATRRADEKFRYDSGARAPSWVFRR